MVGTVATVALVGSGALIAPAGAAEPTPEEKATWTEEEFVEYAEGLYDKAPSDKPLRSAEVTPEPLELPSGEGTTRGTSAALDARAPAWPDGGETLIDIGARGRGKAGGLPVAISRVHEGSAPERVRVKLWDKAAARAAGLEGALIAVDDPAGTGGRSRVSLDLSGILDGVSADYVSRLRLVQVPACALTTPQVPACQSQTVVAGQSWDGLTVSGEVDVAPEQQGASVKTGDAGRTEALAGAGVTVMALDTGAAGSSGDWSASNLSSSASWQVSEQAGSFAWSYPMRVPGVPGGLVPDVTLSYDSGGLDGRTVGTNNQSSVVGDGWELSTGGFIERRYVSCADDKDAVNGQAANNASLSTGDLCWKSDNATLVLGGKSTELVKVSDTVWKSANDDNTRIERVTGTSNGDDNGESWKVTTTDGTVYLFGHAPTSTLVVDVFGNHPGEPCYNASYSAAHCDAGKQAWRWLLSSAQDTSGNTMDLTYLEEVNHYGLNNGASVQSYDRAANVERIDYGTRAGSSAQSPARVVFGYAERCLQAAADCEPADLNATSTARWPDVPFDLICTSTSACPSVTSPSFFTRQRLVSVTTKILSGATTYRDVDSWTLEHSFPDPGDGDLSQAVLWLTGITHTGAAGPASQPTITLPKVSFTGTQLANRVDTQGDARPAMYRWRLADIRTESGAAITVNYAEAECTPATLPSAPETNSKRCFPAFWTPIGATAPVMEYFHKYVVTSVTQAAQAAGSEQTQSAVVNTAYDYSNAGSATMWAFTDDELTLPKYRTWSTWRGYRTVTTYQGVATMGAARQKSTTTYFQGLDGDRSSPTDAGAKRSVTLDGITDTEQYAGMPRSETTYSDNANGIVIQTLSWPWRSPATATDVGNASRQAFHTAVSRQDVITPLAAGGNRTTSTVTTFDPATGLPTAVDDQGDTGISTDDRCTRTTYSPTNTSAHLLGLVERVETVATACANTPARPAQVISDVRTTYDGLAVGGTPTKGLVTSSQEVGSYSGTTPAYVTTQTTAYDTFGRPKSVADALGRTTTTSYTEMNGLTTSQVVTTPDPDSTGPGTALSTTTVLDPAWGAQLKVTDPNGNVTAGAYDALGRLVSVWEPGRVQGTDTASKTFAYTVSATGVNAVTSSTLNFDGSAYVTSTKILDGLLRERQTQAPSASDDAPGRLITDTLYDSRGLAYLMHTAWFTTGAPSTTLVDTTQQRPATTVTTYDGAGRVTDSLFKALGVDRWRTATTYGGDRVTVDPPAGATPTTTVTDARGQTTQLVQYLGATPSGAAQTTTYAYDVAGRLAGMTDAAGNAWSYGHDLRGRQITATDPDKGTTTTTYDDAGQVLTTTDARGKVLAYSYDALGRKTSMREGSATGTVRATWTYDTAAAGKGQLASATRLVGSDAYVTAITGYDHHARPLGQTVTVPGVAGALAGSYTTSYTYTVDGRAKTTAYGAVGNLPAETLYTTYDAANQADRLTAGASTGIYVSATAYSPWGEARDQRLGAVTPVQLTRTYEDGTRRLRTQTLLRDGHDYDATYTYDDAGNITSILDVPDVTGAAADRQCFTYDGLRRLTDAWTPATAACTTAPAVAGLGGPAKYWSTYTYDAVGNRTGVTAHAATDTVATYAYPAPGASGRPHAVTSVTSKTGTTSKTSTYAYDASGNMTGRTLPGTAKQTLTWDAEGELASFAQDGNADGDTADANETDSYVYTADGDRLVRTRDGKTTLYLPGGTEVTASGTEVSAQRYYSLNGQPVAVRTGAGPSGTSSVIANHQATAQLQINQSTNALVRSYSDPFGAPRGAAAAMAGDHGFLDKPKDTTGLTQIGARYYDPVIGKFISVDPIMDLKDPQQWAPYGYSNNNPVTWSDPTGLIVNSRMHLIDGDAKLTEEVSGINPYVGPRTPTNLLPATRRADKPKKSVTSASKAIDAGQPAQDAGSGDDTVLRDPLCELPPGWETWSDLEIASENVAKVTGNMSLVGLGLQLVGYAAWTHLCGTGMVWGCLLALELEAVGAIAASGFGIIATVASVVNAGSNLALGHTEPARESAVTAAVGAASWGLGAGFTRLAFEYQQEVPMVLNVINGIGSYFIDQGFKQAV